MVITIILYPKCIQYFFLLKIFLFHSCKNSFLKYALNYLIPLIFYQMTFYLCAVLFLIHLYQILLNICHHQFRIIYLKVYLHQHYLLNKNNKKLLTGRTDSNKVVIFEGDKKLIGQMIDLKITSEHMWYLKGNIIGKD